MKYLLTYSLLIAFSMIVFSATKSTVNAVRINQRARVERYVK